MAIELVTGRYGTPHISSEDVRAYQAYTAGDGRYIIHGGGVSVTNATTVHLSPVEILADGAHIRITGDGEDVTITPGTSGYNRIDVIALHYQKTDENVESIETYVVTGTSTTGTPSAPSMPATGSILDGVLETYIPYAQLTISSLTPGTPSVLLDEYDSIQQAYMDGDLSLNDLTGPLAVSKGGTGLTSSPSILVNLASTSASNVLQASPRPGVTGTLTVSHGGTGLTSSPSLQVNLASSSASNVFQSSPRPGVTGVLPVSHGGTGSSTVSDALSSLGIYTGTKIVSGNGTTSTLLFSSSDYQSITGHTFNQQTDCVMAMNGDASRDKTSPQYTHLDQCAYVLDDQGIYACFNDTLADGVGYRVNYCIITKAS